jgi:hypothetical protein
VHEGLYFESELPMLCSFFGENIHIDPWLGEFSPFGKKKFFAFFALLWTFKMTENVDFLTISRLTIEGAM